MDTFKGQAFLILLIWNGVVGLAFAKGGVAGVKLKAEKVNIKSSNGSRPGLPDFDSVDVFHKLNFEEKELQFWKSKTFNFEERYKREQTCPSKSGKRSSCTLPPLEVFILPFSHNDAGWLDTFEGYFETQSKSILNNVIEKLTQFPEMTFVWSEISFLAKWWDSVANSTQKEILKKLVDQGRLEILTGGWVMPDEACPTFFALSQQLMEGVEWVRNHLGHKPRAAWSIDPFGHGSVMPYLLKGSGFKGMFIQRMHYAWKHWFAEHKYWNFLWNQRWEKAGDHNGIHCLNAPYCQYPTETSCGPMEDICLQFNFRKDRAIPVTNANVAKQADVLMGQYRRTASLTRHNVVVTGIGADFEFAEKIEWDQQHNNYMKLFQYINSHPERFNAKVGFGTLCKYFEAVERKHVQLPNFKGDFFPYSNTHGYWTGYFSTRPFWKELSRRAEDELRNAEILFTFTFNYLKQLGGEDKATRAEVMDGEDNLSKVFKSLVEARQFLALFQHHDGITGTSPRKTMLDSKTKLSHSILFSERVQGTCMNILVGLGKQLTPSGGGSKITEGTFLSLDDIDVDGEDKKAREPITLQGNGMGHKKLVIFNSAGWNRSHVVNVLVDASDLVVYGPSGQPLSSQINPNFKQDGTVSKHHELIFVAYLEPFTIMTYEIRKITEMAKSRASPASTWPIHPKVNTSLALENEHLKVTFDGDSGLLHQITRKGENVYGRVQMRYGKYGPGDGAGAYESLPATGDLTDLVATCRSDKSLKLFTISGPVIQEVRIICGGMTISYHILKQGSPEAQSALHLTNWIKPGGDGEFFMSFQTDLETKTKSPESSVEEPTFFTDTGLGVERRRKVSRLPYEGNLYPVVNYAFIQDPVKRRRLSVLVDRSHGFTSTKSGHLEAIIDRRIPSDDGKGMSENVMDPESTVSKYVILLESLPATQKDDHAEIWKPTLALQRASKMLNYRPSVFVYADGGNAADPPPPTTSIPLFTKEFPEDVFLLNLRTTTMTNATHGPFPGRTALLTIQNLGHLEQNGVTTPPNRKLGSDLVINHFCISTDLVGDLATKEGLPKKKGLATKVDLATKKDLPSEEDFATGEGEATEARRRRSGHSNTTTTGMLNVSNPFDVNAFLVNFETV